jgi:hypothetical protein
MAPSPKTKKKRPIRRRGTVSVKVRKEWVLCDNNTLCISFGHHLTDIYEFFDGFSWTWRSGTTIEKIGQSSNGFVYMVPYKRDQYTAFAILKSAVNYDTDNLFYEACVGHFLNKQHLYYPCFVQTYRYGTYTDTTVYNKLNDIRSVIINQTLSTLSADTIVLQPIHTIETNILSKINNSCAASQYNCLLMECVPQAKSFNEFFLYPMAKASVNELYTALFQIYSVLSTLRKQYTHYDLHSNNVLLYTPDPDGCIHYKYHCGPQKVVSFYSKQVMKIIDYGRNFFHEEEAFNSVKILENVCKAKKCNTLNSFFDSGLCGEQYGYYLLNNNGNKYHVTPYKKNESHDLLLLYLVRESKKWMELMPWLSKVVYDRDHGTREILDGSGGITNVKHVYQYLKSFLSTTMFIEKNRSEYVNSKVIGTLEVWLYKKKPMVWRKN